MIDSLNPIIINVSVLRAPAKAEFLRNFCIVSNGQSSLSAGEFKLVDNTSWETYVTAENDTKKWLKSFFVNAIGKFCYIYEAGSSGTAQQKLKALETFINDGQLQCYKYSIPADLFADSYMGTLLTNFSTPAKSVYFSAVLGDGDPTTGTYTNWKTKKAFMAFYPSLSDANLNIDGLITGIMASNAYDLSTAKPLSGLFYKVAGSLSKTLTPTLAKQCVDAPACFTAMQGVENVVYNPKYADGTYWHYYYAVDKLKSMIEANINALFVNASKGAGIPYNDMGIATIKSNILTTLQTAQQMQIVNRFAKSIDLGTSQLQGLGDIASVPFEEYKIGNPQDYADSVYGGFSGYIEITQFIRQIIFNITLG